ncbi:uncharacterized protein EV154DRAFT_547707 [Mucor mucedo]|uniref:uncharacterized protein n=1 Tax=Mucor mucedo TaxID=29922 RepID=UPI00221E99F6|nr:uncharacterized protein EV154DRAFT_547707 [Mucor mucedo]KAI7896042.1 hypothetical protein EV154DRAFT_547707 [Mucor mucedo]
MIRDRDQCVIKKSKTLVKSCLSVNLRQVPVKSSDDQCVIKKSKTLVKSCLSVNLRQVPVKSSDAKQYLNMASIRDCVLLTHFPLRRPLEGSRSWSSQLLKNFRQHHVFNPTAVCRLWLPRKRVLLNGQKLRNFLFDSRSVPVKRYCRTKLQDTALDRNRHVPDFIIRFYQVNLDCSYNLLQTLTCISIYTLSVEDELNEIG